MFKNDNMDQEVWISINFNPLRFHVFMGNLMIHQSQKPTPTSVSFQRHSQVIYSDDKLNRTVWVFPLRNVIRNIPPPCPSWLMSTVVSQQQCSGVCRGLEFRTLCDYRETLKSWNSQFPLMMHSWRNPTMCYPRMLCQRLFCFFWSCVLL